MGVQRNQPPRPRPRSGAWYQRALRLPPFVNGYLALVVSPVNGSFTRDRRPNVVVNAQKTSGGSVDIQVEWRKTASGPVAYTTTFINAVSGSPQVIEPDVDLDYYNWYFRVRAGSVSETKWGNWSSTQYVTIYPLPGFASIYVDYNIGVQNINPVPRSILYADMNVGLAPFDVRDAVQYTDFNIGLTPRPRIGAEYMDMNVGPRLGNYEASAYMDFTVNSSTPTPHIWFIQPQVGPEGLMFKIIGQGFGAFQGEYNGKVKLGDLECAIVDWQDIPDGTMDMFRIYQRTDIDINISDGSLLNYYSIRPSEVVRFEAGDTVEFYYRRISPIRPSSSILYWTPYFMLTNSSGSNVSIPNLSFWNDNYGNIQSSPDVPVGEMIHRKFAVPSSFWGSYVKYFGWKYLGGGASGQPAHVVDVSGYVVRNASGDPKFWVMGEDGSPTDYSYLATSVVSTIHVSEVASFIGPDVANVAHQQILALVPDGAESGMVQVVLEG